MQRFAACALALLATACAAPPPANVGFASGPAPCPASPNCVSSDAEREAQRVEPLRFTGDADEAWSRARRALLRLPRTRILDAAPTYLHVESTTALMRYRDDLELWLRPERGEIAVRSASRVGYGDMGANRARVEALRSAFEAQASR